MARTKQKSVTTSKSSSNSIESIDDKTEAFKLCMNHVVDKRFYTVTPSCFFIRPAPRMLKMFTVAEAIALDIGGKKIKAMRDAVGPQPNDYESESDDIPDMTYGDLEIVDTTNKYRHIPTDDQLLQYVLCLKACHPFVNHLHIVNDSLNSKNCWCPMCPSVIEWTKQQCSGFENLVKVCKQDRPANRAVTNGHLKQEDRCVFHLVAHHFLMSLNKQIKSLKKQYPRLELHYVAQPPEYRRDSPLLTSKSHSLQKLVLFPK